jgi:hypothetical protein
VERPGFHLSYTSGIKPLILFCSRAAKRDFSSNLYRKAVGIKFKLRKSIIYI